MSKTASSRNWTLYGFAMILIGLVPIVRSFLPFLLYELIDNFPRLRYGFSIGHLVISTDHFWAIYLLVMSSAFVIYGIVCIVQAHNKRFAASSFSQSVSPGTILPAAFCGMCIGVALVCGLCTVQLLSGPERYPLRDFYGSLGAVVGYIAATVCLIIYAHARRSLFTRKGLVFEIGVAFFGVLVGAWIISVLYYPLTLWEEDHGYLNAFVEYWQQVQQTE